MCHHVHRQFRLKNLLLPLGPTGCTLSVLAFILAKLTQQVKQLFDLLMCVRETLKQVTHRSAINANPPSQRMLWENCRAVPSQQLPHVLSLAGAQRGALHPSW